MLPGDMSQPGIYPSPGQERTVACIFMEKPIPIRLQFQKFCSLCREVPRPGVYHGLDGSKAIFGLCKKELEQ